MGLGQRPEQERGIVILPPYGAVARQCLAQHSRLIPVVAAGGVCVHFLHEVKIRLLLLKYLGDAFQVGIQPLFGPGPGLCSAVHKEAVIRLIGAESNVIGDHGVGCARPDRGRGGAIRRKGEVVLYAVVREEHIDHIAKYYDQQSKTYASGDF